MARFDCAFMHRRMGRGGEGGCSPPKVWATQIFWQQEKIWAKPVFTDVSMFYYYYYFEEINIFYFNQRSA